MFRKIAHFVLPNHLKAAWFSDSWHAFVEENDRDWNAGRYDPINGPGPEAYEKDHQEMEGNLFNLLSYEGQCWYVWKEFLRLSGNHQAEVLELGSGSGFFSRRLIKECRHLEIHDINPHFLHYVADLLKREGNVNFSLNSSDLYKFNSNRKFDAVLFFGTLHHLNRRVKVLSQISKYLKSPGYVLLVEPTHNLKRVVRILYKAASQYLWDGTKVVTHDFLTHGEVRSWGKSLMENAGVKNVQVLDLHSFQFPGSRKFKKSQFWSPERIELTLQKVPFLGAEGNCLTSVLRIEK